MTAGFEMDAFWHQTIKTLMLAMRAKAAAFRQEQNARAWMAWHIAAWGRAKKLPPLNKVLIKEPVERQPWQRQMQIMEVFGAELRRSRQGKGAKDAGR